MMDLKEIIRWFIPCFHLLLLNKRKIDSALTLVYLFLFFNLCAGLEAKGNSDVDLIKNNNLDNTKKLDLYNRELNSSMHQSDYFSDDKSENESKSLEDSSVGRTFGRPFMKKMMTAMLPLVFQIGAASTWAVVAALVGVKTLAVTLLILKLLLVAGAAKFGAFFANKGHYHEHQSHGWEPPHQKEIHLHIHNGQLGYPEHHEEHAPIAWSRGGPPSAYESKAVNIVVDPYRAGPQTISTPYGNYVKVDPSSNI